MIRRIWDCTEKRFFPHPLIFSKWSSLLNSENSKLSPYCVISCVLCSFNYSSLYHFIALLFFSTGIPPPESLCTCITISFHFHSNVLLSTISFFILYPSIPHNIRSFFRSTTALPLHSANYLSIYPCVFWSQTLFISTERKNFGCDCFRVQEKFFNCFHHCNHVQKCSSSEKQVLQFGYLLRKMFQSKYFPQKRNIFSLLLYFSSNTSSEENVFNSRYVLNCKILYQQKLFHKLNHVQNISSGKNIFVLCIQLSTRERHVFAIKQLSTRTSRIGCFWLNE